MPLQMIISFQEDWYGSLDTMNIKIFSWYQIL